MNQVYDQNFYENLANDDVKRNTFRDYYVPEMQTLYHHELKSVIDFGCGVGTLLAEFEKIGIHDVIGVDLYNGEKLLEISADKYIQFDLNNIDDQSSILADKIGRRKYDLACCLDVAEHIKEQCAEKLVDMLTSYSDVILFAAAIPYQGGVGHVNEQWPAYWEEKFTKHKYLKVDYFRRKFWDQYGIGGYYRQNVMLYVKEESLQYFPELKDFYFDTKYSFPAHVVHPTVYSYSVRDAMCSFNLDRYPRFNIAQEKLNQARLLCSREELLKKVPKGGVCVEVGVAYGEFSRKILDICKPKKLYCIDTFWSEKAYQGTLENLKEGIENGIVEIMKGDSAKMLGSLSNESIDFVYIDANHDYEHPKKELEICKEKVKMEGLIAGHDYVCINVFETPLMQYGVINAVNEFVENNDYEFVYMTMEQLNITPSFCIRKRN